MRHLERERELNGLQGDQDNITGINQVAPTDNNKQTNTQKKVCNYCKKPGHFKAQCRAYKRFLDSQNGPKKMRCEICHRTNHETKDCRAKEFAEKRQAQRERQTQEQKQEGQNSQTTDKKKKEYGKFRLFKLIKPPLQGEELREQTKPAQPKPPPDITSSNSTQTDLQADWQRLVNQTNSSQQEEKQYPLTTDNITLQSTDCATNTDTPYTHTVANEREENPKMNFEIPQSLKEAFREAQQTSQSNDVTYHTTNQTQGRHALPTTQTNGETQTDITTTQNKEDEVEPSTFQCADQMSSQQQNNPQHQPQDISST